ncbi:MAG TPA: energy transducer TonB [Spirochaetota bacterium]|nr:energy transducer TonB [Spirochaetota bacterium]HPL15486.1 energy transducer TonB [Spirochaetota bacterium]HQF10180.1 energy transducer TonB [Spirochaetota bacterium]HQH98964.1 energy transducer TonB [Spirochaetota bacterium]HQJ71941.1 energy transducer TonB [Spirochaetota bacterium]
MEYMKKKIRMMRRWIRARDRFTLCIAVSLLLHGSCYAAYFIATRPWEGLSLGQTESEPVDAEFLDIPPELVRFDSGDSNPAPVEKKEWVEGGSDHGRDPVDDGEDRVSGTGTDKEGYYFSFSADRMPEPIVDFDLNDYFPREARSASVRRKTVIVMVSIDEGGSLRGAEVVSEPAGLGFDEAALTVVRRMRFRPGRKGGKPVKMICKLPITFELNQ